MLKNDQINIVSIALIGFILIAINSCQPDTKDDHQYLLEIDKWHEQRIDNLKQKDSWLSLAGLFWLDEGTNTFGADSSNDLIFPAGKSPDHLGRITKNGDTIRVHINPDITVKHNGQPVQQMILKTGNAADPTVLEYGSLSWHIIERDDRYALRLKDAKNKSLTTFDGIERFPVRQNWRIKAIFNAFDSSQTMQIPTVTGQPATMVIPGTLQFDLNGESFELTATAGNEDAFFVIFGDETNGRTTYGGGRYLYVEKPGEGFSTYIDFNQAYNPPCVFNDYATCPLPPPANRLNIAITAGEKMYNKNPG